MEENNAKKAALIGQDETAAESVEASAQKKGFARLVEQIKSFPLKKIVIFAAAAAAVLCAALFGGKILTNSYKTPVRIMEKYNNDCIDSEEYTLARLNGFAEKDFERLFEILHNSEVFEEIIEDNNGLYLRDYKANCAKYGDDYKVKYSVTDKTELSASDFKDCTKHIQETFRSFRDIADCADDFTSSDWSYMAYDLDMARSDAKELIDIIREIGDKYEKVKITDGYRLKVTITTTGSKLNKPVETDCTLTVLKINGRWTDMNSFYGIENIIVYDLLYYYW